ncbi:MAG: PAS domain-containing sensor histidine kinase, partial [Candidatus Thorarchaeota archaeon]
MEKEFTAFLIRKQCYDQVRILDKNGKETVRVNFNDGKPEPVPKEKLQFKAQRYYFYEASGLSKNEVFVSQFDLNIEEGRIEIPYKPMVRFVTPVFDSSGKKQGLLVLNYLGR